MSMMSSKSWISPSVLLLTVVACGSQAASPSVAPGPARSGESPLETQVEEPPSAEAEVTLADRWGSPFAVSSSGRVAPREPREVTIVRMDPAIAAGVASIRSAQRSGETRTGGSGDADELAESKSTDPGAAWSPVRSEGVEFNRAWEDEGATGARVEEAAATAGAPGSGSDVGTAGTPRGTRTHRVGVGDTLWGIARRYNVDPERIRRANEMSDDRVRLGETLIIPE